MVASDPAAAAVAVAGAEGKAPAGSGRRLVATRDVAAGEVVLTEAPFAAALLDEEVRSAAVEYSRDIVPASAAARHACEEGTSR